jgi:DNA-binding transcriptional regulator YbjK
MPRPRRHRAAGQARRDALLVAAVEVAAEEGAGAVTHRRVTEQAGVPLATASYFFSSIDELATEAMRVFAGARTAELLALATSLGRDRHSPEEMAAALGAAVGTTRTLHLAQFEAYLHAARSAPFRPVVAEAVAAFEHVAEVALRAVGAADPGPLAASFVALADGMVLRELALPGSLPPGALHRAFRALYVGALLEAAQPDDRLPVSPP